MFSLDCGRLMSLSPDPDEVSSPCIGMCTVDALGVCLGCCRSLREIAEWSSASDHKRRQILQQAQRRRVGTEIHGRDGC